MSVFWSEDERLLLEKVRATLSSREISQLWTEIGYDRSPDAIQKQSKKLGCKFVDFGEPQGVFTKQEQAAISRILENRYHATLTTLSKTATPDPNEKAKLTKGRRGFVNELLESLYEIREEVERTGSKSAKRAHGNKKSLCVFLSDTHFGRHLADPETGEDYFNVKIASERILSVPNKILSILTEDQIDQIDEVVLFLGGDMVDGEGIFGHQAMELETHAVEQVKAATKAFWQIINVFRGTFPLVRIITTKGNHGAAHTSPEANWDNMIYQQLELLIDLDIEMGGDLDVTIKNRYGDYAIGNVRGWKVLMRHKAPVQADTGAGIAKYAGWYGIHEWDAFLFGHFHHWGVMTWNGKPILRNGSLAGGDDYAESLAYFDLPVQLAWIATEDTICEQVVPIRFGDE